MNTSPNMTSGKTIRRSVAGKLAIEGPGPGLSITRRRLDLSGGNLMRRWGVMLRLLFLGLALDLAQAQDSSGFRFTHLSVEDGLSDSAMSSAVQDRQGFMWFGTERGGLNRYDGCEFKVYQNEEGNARSLSRNNVTALLLDRQGILWVGTGGGLCRYNRDTDDFTCYRPIPGDDTSICDIVVTALCEDASGAIWVGTEKGLCKLDPKTGKFFTWRHDPNNPHSLSSDLVRSVFADPQGGQLWVGTVADGACVLDPNTGEFTAYHPDPDVPGSIGGNDVTCFLRDKAGVLWVSTGNGLDRFAPETRTFVHYRHDPKDTNSLSDNYVWALYEDRAGRFWVCTPRGLNFMDRRRGIFTHILAIPNDQTRYCAASVNHVCEDNTGAVWATSHLYGVVRLPSEPEKFQVYSHNPDDTNSLCNSIVESIHVDRNNRVWIGTLGGLDYLDDCRPPVKHSITTDTHAVAEDSQGRIWAGAFPQGLFRIQGDNITHYSHDPNNSNSLASDQIWTLATDDQGNLWIIYWAVGVGRFDGKTFTHYTADPADPQRLASGLIWGSANDTNGFIWLVGNGGLTRLDPTNTVFTTYYIDPEHPENEINRPFISVYIDRGSPGEMWVGTLSGLFQFDRASGKFTRRYTKKDGLPTDNVQSIQRDNQGRLWVGTTVGLSRFDPVQRKFRNYDKSDGLPGNKFFVGAATRAPDGQLFFGNTEGLVAFYPDKVRDNPNPPPVVLTDFELFNKSVAIGDKESPLKRAINVVDEVTLRRDQSVFTFKFAALNYTAPEKNRYAYKLEGFDNDWRYTDTKRRFATYTSLAPGHYVFRVKASNNDGLWNEQGVSLKINILPPWWATWWFRSLAAMAILSLTAAGFHWRIQSITRHAAELEVEVAQRTRSLSERTAQLQAANQELESFSYSVSHDLRAPLRAINEFSRIVLEDNAGQLNAAGREHLERVRAASQRMGHLIDDLLQLSRISHGELHCKPVDLSAQAQAIAGELKLAAPDRQVEFVITPGLVARADATLLRAVLENLLGNAWKFTSKQPSARIEFGATTHDGQPAFFVRDNGAGFDMAYAGKLFGAFQRLHRPADFPGTGIGLATVQRIIHRHGGRVWAEAEINRGATFYFSLPPAA